MQNPKNKEANFMALYNPVHAKFERFCRARVYGEIEYKDLMHDTILIAYEKIDTLKNEKAFLHFLFGIAIRVLANRNRKKHPDYLKENKVAFQLADESHDPNKRDDLEMLYQGLAKLSEEKREALILFEISGFSIVEVAELQGAGVSAVKQRLSRARSELLEILKSKQPEMKKSVGV